MIYRDLRINKDKFYQQLKFPFVTSDKGCYRVITDIPEVQNILITSKRADGKVFTQISEGNSSCVLKQSLYGVEGEMSLLISVSDEEGNVLSTNEFLGSAITGLEGETASDDNTSIALQAYREVQALNNNLSNYYTSTKTDELLKNKVDTDQYASTTQAGIIKLAADMSGKNMSCIEVGEDGSAKIKDGFGVKNAVGTLQIVAATKEQIDGKANPYFPITPSNLDYAVNSVENVNKLISGYINSYKEGIDVNTLIENGIYRISSGINTPDVPPTWEGGSTDHGTLIVTKIPGEDANRYYVTQIFIVGDDTGYGIWQRTLYITEGELIIDVDWTDISGYTELKATKADKPTIINYIGTEEVPISITLENNTVYQFDVISELDIAYPEEITDSFETLIYFSSNETNINFIYPDGSGLETKMSGQDCIDNTFAPVANKRYELSLKWDGKYMNGLVGAVSL